MTTYFTADQAMNVSRLFQVREEWLVRVLSCHHPLFAITQLLISPCLRHQLTLQLAVLLNFQPAGPEDDTLKGGQGQAEGSDTPQPTSGTVDQGQPGNDSFRGDAPPPVEQTEAVEPENAAEEKAPATVPIGENLIVNGSFENHGDLNRGSWGTFDEKRRGVANFGR